LSRIRVLYILSVSFEGDFKLEKPCGSILINIDTTIKAQKRVIYGKQTIAEK
jgi:hypothetical protein